MTVSLKHTFQSVKTDSADATLVQPSNWNEEHELTAAAGKVLGRDTSGAGAVQELPISVTPAGDVTIPNNFAVTGTTTLTNALGVASGGTGLATLPANNVLIGNGTSAVASVAPSTSGNILTSNGTAWTSAAPPAGSPSFEAIASGTLPDGTAVVVNEDGSVRQARGAAASVGSEVVFDTSSSPYVCAAYDANAQKVVVAYQDVGNSSFGTAVVGTISGSTISFGSPFIFASVSVSFLSIVYDSAQQKIVIAGKFNTRANAVVGSVSGSNITFGTATEFSTVTVYAVGMAYDNSQQKVVCFHDSNRSALSGSVGTVSGTSISFGTETTIGSTRAEWISADYDQTQQKVVVAYDEINTAQGYAVAAAVSGTSLTFGTPVSLNATAISTTAVIYDPSATKCVVLYSNDVDGIGYARAVTITGTTVSFGVAASIGEGSYFGATYDANAETVVVAYRSTSSNGFARSMDVSGTTVSFGANFTFNPAGTDYIGCAYDSVQQKVAIAYRDVGNTNRGTAIVFQVAFTTLTAENFIGFSDGAYTNGQTATIHVAGAVDDAQSSLTPGQSYYVQTSGGISLTPDSPSVFAGTAVAATKIIVKG